MIVERASGRVMMSGFHGLYSLGGILGVLGVSALLASLAVVLVLHVALYKARPDLLPFGSSRSGPLFALPRGLVLVIGVMCFIVFLAEGAMLDWSAIFLADVQGVSPSQAGLGYAVFALTMTVGRLAGDAIVSWLGERKVIVMGALCAAAGLAIATLVDDWRVDLLGFALVGIGCANIVPVMFSAVGRQQEMSVNLAIPAVTTMGYSGVLLGPAFIGFMAHATSLPVAFFVVAGLLIGVAAGA